MTSNVFFFRTGLKVKLTLTIKYVDMIKKKKCVKNEAQIAEFGKFS